MSNIADVLAFDPVQKQAEQQPDISEVLQFDPTPPQEQVKPPSPPTPEDEKLSWREAVVEGFQNIPESGYQFLSDITAPIHSPKEFVTGVKNMAVGAYQKTTPGVQDKEVYVDAIVDFYKNRYGTTDGFKQAIAKDPVGVLADAASVVTAGGGLLKGAGAVTKSSTLAKAGTAMSKTGMAMEPINIAKEILRQPLKIVPKENLIKMYQSSVKFGTTIDSKKLNRIVNTALMEEIMPTSKGLVKLVNKIEDYNTEVTRLINEAGETGQKIKVSKLAEGLEELRKTARMTTDQPKLVDAAFKRVRDNLVEMTKDGYVRSPAQIQKIKTTIYKDLKSLYEQNMSAPIKHKFRKAIARNAKDSLEEIIPEIKHLNKSEGALLELLDEIESKAHRIENRDIISIGLPVKMGAASGVGYMFGGQEGGKLGSQLGFMLGIYDTPQIKAKLTIVINRLKEKGITVKPTATLVRLGIYELANPEKFSQETDENIAP